MGKYEILAEPDRCTGCLRCQLSCSELHAKASSLAMAKIRVVLSGVDCSIDFTDDCNECGVCVDNCLYDALKKKKREEDVV